MTNVSKDDVETLIHLFDQSDWQELRVTVEGMDIFLSKNPASHSDLPALTSHDTDSPATTNEPGVAQPELVTIRAPHLGTFHTGPEPGAPPSISIGQKVEAGTEICGLQVMQRLTSLRVDRTGTVRSICVEDAQLVEYDQPLFVIEPSA